MGPQKIKKKTDFGENFAKTRTIQTILLICIILLGVGLMSGLIQSNISSVRTEKYIDTLGYILIILTVIYKVLWNIQQVYVIFGLVRNPLYSYIQKNKQKIVSIVQYYYQILG